MLADITSRALAIFNRTFPGHQPRISDAMSAPLANGSLNSYAGCKTNSYTITSMKRWSCIVNKEIPPVSQIKSLHLYDFDNTLFMSPLPNQKLWASQTVGLLQEQHGFINGGWWHDVNILGATGGGIEKEEPKAWEGWWNEQIADLVRLSMEQKDALTVLLTGRAEEGFAGLIRRMVASKKLQFDMICLKPLAGPSNQKFTSTMKYKQALLEDLMYTYKDADEIRVYEDRIGHVSGFRDFFRAFNKKQQAPDPINPRKPIVAEVIQVADQATTLDPIVEVAEIQRIINGHNVSLYSGSYAPHIRPWEIKRNVFYTGYLIAPNDTEKLLSLFELPPQLRESQFLFLANNVLIIPRPCPDWILNKIGGIGHRQTWRITGIGIYENKVWAARLEPIPANSIIHTDNSPPLVVLAHQKGARPADAGRIQNWQYLSPEQSLVFESVVGEKAQLRVEPESEAATQNRTQYGFNNKRKLEHEEGEVNERYRNNQYSQGQPRHKHNDENRRFGGGGQNGNYRGGNQNRGRVGGQGRGGHPPYGNRGGRGGNRGGAGGGGGRGRGRGGYKSLDDMNGNCQGQHRQFDGPSDSLASGNGGYDAAFPPIGGGDVMQY